MTYLKVLILLFITQVDTYAHDYLYRYGEHNFGLYAGPLYPEFEIDEYDNKVTFISDVLKQEYFDHLIEPEFFYLVDYFEKAQKIESCPNEMFNNHFELIRHYYRVSFLALLDVFLEDLSFSAQGLRIKSSCEYDVNALLAECSAKTAPMKTFIEQAQKFKHRIQSQGLLAQDAPANFQAAWVKNEKTKMIQDRLSHKFVGLNHKHNGELKDFFKQTCRESKEVFQLLCSERDELYGASQSLAAYRLALSLTTFPKELTNQEQSACFIRFSRVMQGREKYSSLLNQMLPLLYEYKSQTFSRLKPRLAAIGSLSEYQKDDFVSFVPTGAGAIPLVANKQQTGPVVLGPLAPSDLPPLVRPVDDEKVVELPKEEITQKLPEKTHFLRVSELRREFDLDKAKVDMEKFTYDYVFTSKIMAFLDTRLEVFFQRKSLEEMKQYDGLGTLKGPVPLLFIKYLIEQNQFQGLYNLIDVIGEKFYVTNGLDDKVYNPAPEYIQLQYTQAPLPPWQIFILSANEN